MTIPWTTEELNECAREVDEISTKVDTAIDAAVMHVLLLDGGDRNGAFYGLAVEMTLMRHAANMAVTLRDSTNARTDAKIFSRTAREAFKDAERLHAAGLKKSAVEPDTDYKDKCVYAACMTMIFRALGLHGISYRGPKENQKSDFMASVSDMWDAQFQDDP
jgi:hypothetical protein